MSMASPVADFPARRPVKSSIISAFVMAAALVSACGVSEPQAASTSPARSTPVLTTSVSGAAPQGFESLGLRVIPTADLDREEIEMCVWAAVTPEQRSRGLMGVTDLGGLHGMAFIYDEERTTSFTMRNTLIDLSIAFFDAEGAFLDAFDMEPCGGEPCPSYPTPAGFRLAIEVPAGDFALWGIGPGSAVFLRSDCDTP